VLQPISHDAQSQSLHFGNRFRLRLTVSHHSREIRNLGQPAAILFSFNFDQHNDSRNIRQS
jgi:hypothetical protein